MSWTAFLSDGPVSYITPISVVSGVSDREVGLAVEYVEFAKQDLDIGSDRGLINAFGHCKRALHVMVDALLASYGLLARNRRAKFPVKLELLEAADLMSLRILRQLNVERNVMEHEHQLPDEERVSDAIDVCRLMLLAISQLSLDITCEGVVGLRADGSHAVMRLDVVTGSLQFFHIPTSLIELTAERHTEYVPLDAYLDLESTGWAPGQGEGQASTVVLSAKQVTIWKGFLQAIAAVRSPTGFKVPGSRPGYAMVTRWIPLNRDQLELVEPFTRRAIRKEFRQSGQNSTGT